MNWDIIKLGFHIGRTREEMMMVITKYKCLSQKIKMYYQNFDSSETQKE